MQELLVSVSFLGLAVCGLCSRALLTRWVTKGRPVVGVVESDKVVSIPSRQAIDEDDFMGK